MIVKIHRAKKYQNTRKGYTDRFFELEVCQLIGDRCLTDDPMEKSIIYVTRAVNRDIIVIECIRNANNKLDKASLEGRSATLSMELHHFVNEQGFSVDYKEHDHGTVITPHRIRMFKCWKIYLRTPQLGNKDEEILMAHHSIPATENMLSLTRHENVPLTAQITFARYHVPYIWQGTSVEDTGNKTKDTKQGHIVEEENYSCQQGKDMVGQRVMETLTSTDG